MQARNYQIEEVDNFKVKLIAGKIIPAIATTTAMVVGAVGIEIIKYLLGKNASFFKNVTINLALPLWVFNDPLEAIVNTDKEFDPIMCGPIKVIPGSTSPPMQSSPSGRRSTSRARSPSKNSRTTSRRPTALKSP
jgi:ubiquitin-activating enzyme E1